MLNNPLLIGFGVAAAVYLYRIHQRSQEPEENRKDVSFLLPAVMGCMAGGAMYLYNNQNTWSDVDSDFESVLVNPIAIDHIAPMNGGNHQQVYTSIW